MLRRMVFITLAACLWASSAVAAPLHDAAIRGDAAQIKALLAGGADANVRDKIGKAPLDWAAFRGAYIPV